jgi:hypothetical protein
METDPLDAQTALDAVATAERRSAQIATSTPWYAPWYGVTCALIPAAIGIMGSNGSLAGVGAAVLAVALASLSLLVTTYQRVTGVWPAAQGLTPQIVAVIVLMFGAGIGFFLAARSYGLGWWLVVGTVVTAVLMALLSRSYDRALVRKHSVR